jgi:hypothetical protein
MLAGPARARSSITPLSDGSESGGVRKTEQRVFNEFFINISQNYSQQHKLLLLINKLNILMSPF